MKLGKFKITNRGLYWGLIIAFALLYLCVGFVSTLHSITFFHLANTMSLAVLLGLTYEVGQASVLFSILMSEKNQGKFLPWLLMILLTALQVTANVYASFKYMVQSGSNDWIFWQKSILFGVQSSNPEFYQMIISWISGALLPIVALGMTALVAQNMKFMNEENEEHSEPIDEYKLNAAEPEEGEENAYDEPESPSKQEIDEIIENEVQKRMAEIPLETMLEKYKNTIKPEMNPRTEMSETIEDAKTDIKDTSVEEDDMNEEVARLTPDINHPLGKYDMKFGPEFTETMNEIHDELVAEEAIQEINDSIDKQEKTSDNIDIIEEAEIVPPEEIIEIIPEKRKRGRPPKQKDNVVELKKTQEPLPKEEVKVPLKTKRTVNPLKLKEKKIKPLKSLKEINKPSKGDEVIALLEKMEKEKQKESITPLTTVTENPQDSILVPPELKDDYASYVMDGVEVIDAKAVPKKKVGQVDKFGIPINPGEHRNFDKI